jgi:ketosteroid isomerase-like protein
VRLGRVEVGVWVAAYEQAWRTVGTGALRNLFTDDATYRMSPYAEPAVGLERIGELWERERQGYDEEFEMTHEIVAVEADTAVVRVEVQYGPPDRSQYRDLWVVRFAADGRCREFEEWPFWPGQTIVAEKSKQHLT